MTDAERVLSLLCHEHNYLGYGSRLRRKITKHRSTGIEVGREGRKNSMASGVIQDQELESYFHVSRAKKCLRYTYFSHNYPTPMANVVRI